MKDFIALASDQLARFGVTHWVVRAGTRECVGGGIAVGGYSAYASGPTESQKRGRGRPDAPTAGDEYFGNVIIKTNSNGQASVKWQAFLRAAGFRTTPAVVQDSKDGVTFGFRYSNNSNTAFLFTQERPDLATHGKSNGWAGDVVLFVRDGSPKRFGEIRSALASAAATGVPRTYRKRTQEQKNIENALMSGLNVENADGTFSPVVTDLNGDKHIDARDRLIHKRTLGLMSEAGSGNARSQEDFMRAYQRFVEQARKEFDERNKRDGEDGGGAAVTASAGSRLRKHVAGFESYEAMALTIKFKTSVERAKERRKAKLFRLKNKSKLKLQRKKYRLKMKHRKPDAKRSRIAKQVAKHYKHHS